MDQVIVFKGIKYGFVTLFQFIKYNFVLLFLTGFFAYRTFFLDRLNYALLALLLCLFFLVVCQAIYNYCDRPRIRIIYRTALVLSVTSLTMALCIQTLRFIYVFVPTLTEPTLSRILVRIGILTVTFYAYATIFAFIYYLYVHDMLSVIWNGSVKRLLRRNPSAAIRRDQWRRERFSSLLFINVLLWGGLASVLTLVVGFVAWLLR
ncbi:MAG: hypothetical protein J0I20_34425 [Chloroflexi bacterium]|nr:hypothetical protein [Chloroflexota bacterium]OJV91088.1 MAG: hypothetical protein BGO39_26205 [Chloroflexi bacterium 54-19]